MSQAAAFDMSRYTGSLPTRPFLRDAGKALIPGAIEDVDFLNQLGPIIQQIVMNLMNSMTQAGVAADAQRIRTAGAGQAKRAARGTSDPNLARDVEFEGVNQANLIAQQAIAHAFSPEGAFQIAQGILPMASNPALTARLGAVEGLNSNVSTSNIQKSPPKANPLSSILGLGAQMYGAGAFNPTRIAQNIFNPGGGSDASSSYAVPAMVR